MIDFQCIFGTPGCRQFLKKCSHQRVEPGHFNLASPGYLNLSFCPYLGQLWSVLNYHIKPRSISSRTNCEMNQTLKSSLVIRMTWTNQNYASYCSCKYSYSYLLEMIKYLRHMPSETIDYFYWKVLIDPVIILSLIESSPRRLTDLLSWLSQRSCSMRTWQSYAVASTNGVLDMCPR